MANQKITQLGALATPTTDDLVAIVNDPAGTPLTGKTTLAQLIAALLLSNVTIQTLTATAGSPYTPTAGMKKCLVIAVGPGGNGANVTGADDASGGGGGGGCCIKLFTAAQVGASKVYVIGAASGTNTTWNTTDLVASSGSNGSATGNTATLGAQAAGGAGGAATGGDLNIPGEPGMRSITYSGSAGCGGAGGASALGNGGAQSGTDAAGNVGTAYGGGGGGCHTSADADRTGGAGAGGIIYVIEFLA